MVSAIDYEHHQCDSYAEVPACDVQLISLDVTTVETCSCIQQRPTNTLQRILAYDILKVHAHIHEQRYSAYNPEQHDLCIENKFSF